MELNYKIINFLDDYSTNKYGSTNEAVEAVKEIFKQYQALQLQQTGVSKSLPSDIEVGKAMSELSKIADKEAER